MQGTCSHRCLHEIRVGKEGRGGEGREGGGGGGVRRGGEGGGGGVRREGVAFLGAGPCLDLG